MFDNQMQTYKSTKAFSEASEQINQINSSMVKEAEKRQAITQVSMGLAQNLLNAGAPVARIDAALKAFAPAPLMSSEEQIVIGTQFNDKETLNLGKTQQRQQAAVGEELYETRAQRKYLRDLELMGIKAASSPAEKLPESAISKIQDFDSSLYKLDDISKRMAADPQLSAYLSGRVPMGAEAAALFNPKFATFKSDVGRFFDNYRKLISGVAVSEKEMQMLQANVPTIKDPPKVFIAKTKSFQKELTKIRDKYIGNLQKGGYKAAENFMNLPSDLDGGKERSRSQPLDIDPDMMPTIRAIPGLKME